MTAVQRGVFTTLYVTNVLNGTVASGEAPVDGGTIARIRLLTCCGHAPTVISKQVIAGGFWERTDKVALVKGPTGVAFTSLPFDFGGVLFVADTVGNRIAAVVAFSRSQQFSYDTTSHRTNCSA